MTEEAQRVALAEACGYRKVRRFMGRLEGELDGRLVICLPNYPHSFDAMHEAEKVLTTWKLRSKYVDYLDTIIPESALCFAEDDAATRYFNAFSAVHATAAQRLEAILRTLNLWDDTK